MKPFENVPKHKTCSVTLTPKKTGAVIDIRNTDESTRWEGTSRTVEKHRHATVNLDDWELVLKYEDSPNLAKLKKAGHSETEAIKILDALEIE